MVKRAARGSGPCESICLAVLEDEDIRQPPEATESSHAASKEAVIEVPFSQHHSNPFQLLCLRAHSNAHIREKGNEFPAERGSQAAPGAA